ncbi:MAG: DUF459 domain-containing protein [Hyphomicrobiales bacterium]
MRHIFHVLALIGLTLVTAAAGGLAQEQGRTAPPSNGYNVFIIGDALAGGLWAGTTRTGGQYPDFAITGRFKEGSGLARPEIYDWASAVPKILERHHVDLAIVFIGTNDGQDIRTDSGRVAFGTPEWAESYKAEVDEIVSVFMEHGVTVYWIGLPPMQSASHDEAVSIIAELQRERVLAGGAKYIDVRPEFATEDGGFAQSGIGIDGRETRLRSLDGIKFIKAGNDKLSTMVFDAISADLGLGSPGPVVAEGGAEFADNEALADLPLFGQELADGSPRTLNAADLPVRLAEQDQVQGARLDLDQAADTPAAPNSAAAALFDSGHWPDPKPGRIDDFTWPQQ